MKKNSNLVFLPNTGKENFYPSTPEMIENKLSAKNSADNPTVSSLNFIPVHHSSRGMIPIKNKPKR